MPFQKTVILPRLRAFVYSFFTFGMMGVVVILVHRANGFRDINNRHTGGIGKPYHPVVPSCAANHQFWNLVVVKALLKNEIIDELNGSLAIRLFRKPPDFHPPAGKVEVQDMSEIYIPPPPSGQELLSGSAYKFNGAPKIFRQHDIAIGVTQQIMTGNFLRPVENTGHIV